MQWLAHLVQDLKSAISFAFSLLIILKIALFLVIDCYNVVMGLFLEPCLHVQIHKERIDIPCPRILILSVLNSFCLD